MGVKQGSSCVTLCIKTNVAVERKAGSDMQKVCIRNLYSDINNDSKTYAIFTDGLKVTSTPSGVGW